MKSTIIAVSLLALFLTAAPAQAELWTTFQPDPADLYDLDHHKYYTWGLSTDKDISLIVVTTVRLKFDNIRNWDSNPNVLYVHLLDTAPDGVRVYSDNQGGGDNFAGEGVELVTYENLPNTAQDLTYTFTAEQVGTFNDYIQNGSDVGFGFDPDCHFWNDGVSLEVGYEVVPEPGCVVLLATGAVLAVLRKRSRR